MIDFLLPTIMLALLAWDAWRLRCEQRGANRRGRKRLIGCWLVADSLPLLLHASFLIDNTPPVMRTAMWIIWSWLLLTSARLSIGFFSLIRLRGVGYLVALVVAALFIYGAVWGRKALYVKRVEICSERLPAAFDGYRMALFSDLHLGALVNTRSEVGALVERLNALDVDAVLFAGDLVNIRHSELDDTATELLQRIRPKVFSVIGNHDVGTYIGDTVRLPAELSYRRLMEQQRAMGWTVLQDTTLYLKRGGDSVSLSGFAYNPAFKKERHDRDLPMSGADKGYDGVPDSLYNITLIHVPQHWEEILARGYGDLTLSGHTHAMQFKLRLGDECQFSPAALLYEQWSGRYDSPDGRTLYINDGIGYVGYPLRIGARPEITLITLKRCE
ncbi:MAG: metallophosphoesterase [Rikenellaceae bacterium]|nr:metallophosphoesterase [Rikenellaceae bacterium]